MILQRWDFFPESLGISTNNMLLNPMRTFNRQICFLKCTELWAFIAHSSSFGLVLCLSFSSQLVQLLLILRGWAYMLLSETPEVKDLRWPPSKMALNHPHTLAFLPLWSLSPWVWAEPSDQWNSISNIRLYKDSGFCLACPLLLAHSCHVMSCPLCGKKLRGWASGQQPGSNWGPRSYNSWGTEPPTKVRVRLEADLSAKPVDETASQQSCSNLEAEAPR